MLNQHWRQPWVALIPLLAIILWGGWLRLAYLGEPSFWIDEAFSLEVAQQWLQGIATIGDWRAWLHRALLAGNIALFGEAEWLVRLPSVLAGIMLIGAVTSWMWWRLGRFPALFSALVLSTNYWQIAWSRQAREYIFLSLAVFVSLWTIDYLARKKSSTLKFITTTFALTIVAMSFHLFGLIVLLAGALRLALDEHYLKNIKQRSLGVFFISVAAGASIVLLRSYLGNETSRFDLYGSFLWREYWSILLLIAPALLTLKNPHTRLLIVWLALVFVTGFLVIVLTVPLINFRYLFFLTPALVVIAATPLRTLTKPLAALYFVFSVAWLAYHDQLVVTPQPEYTLEQQSTGAGHRFYTPQPDFRLAYEYIDSRLGKVDLVTPYPAVSRRYRDIDDTMAINANIQYPYVSRHDRGATEFYTGLYFASAGALFQLMEQVDELYILVDIMAQQRMDPQIRLLLNQFGQPIESWQKPPYSSLYLYRLERPKKAQHR